MITACKFFDRYYRPEYTTIIVAGDVKREASARSGGKVLGRVEAWRIQGGDPRGAAAGRSAQPRGGMAGATLPLIGIAFKSPAYTDSAKDTAALDALSYLAFSENSELYQKLIIREQKADALFASAPKQVDAGLFQVLARVKKPEDVEYVRDQILATIHGLQEQPVDEKRLDTVRQHIRYELALAWIIARPSRRLWRITFRCGGRPIP